MKPWAAIVRISHIGTRDPDTLHADTEQVDEVQRYAASHGMTVEYMAPELSVSGGKPIEERPSLKAAIEGVEQGRYSGIVAAYLSRLTRSRSGLEIWDRVERAGGTVHAAREQLDTSTPNGRFIRDIHLANAVREREEHAERHAERRRKTVEAGIWRVRQTPVGYRFAGPEVAGRHRGQARRLVPSDQAGLVTWAFQARGAGTPIQAIADRLEMTATGVRRMLANRVYLGELRDGEHVNPAAHQPLVDPATFEAAQLTVARPPRAKAPPALLAGLVRCSGCGHAMSRSSTRQSVYVCNGHPSGHRCPAPAGISVHRLDQFVEPIVLRELAQLQAAAGGGDGGVREAKAALADAERRLRDYMRAGQGLDIGAEFFAEGARERQREVTDARTQLHAAMARQPVMPLPDDAWERLDVHERNTVLRGLLEAVVVAKAGRGRVVPVADRVRVIARGAGLNLPDRRAGRPQGLRSLPLQHLDGPHVLRPLGGEDPLEGGSG